jgi:hypothetical protein
MKHASRPPQDSGFVLGVAEGGRTRRTAERDISLSEALARMNCARQNWRT